MCVAARVSEHVFDTRQGKLRTVCEERETLLLERNKYKEAFSK